MQKISTPNPIEVVKEHVGMNFVHIEYSINYNNPFHTVIIISPKEIKECLAALKDSD